MSTDPLAADLLPQFLAGRDVPCPQCGYNLRDLAGDRCPECGEPLVLRVNVSEPKQAWLLVGLIGLSAGAGFNGLLLLYVVVQLIMHHGFGPMLTFVVVNAIGLLAMAAFIGAYLRAWRRIRRLPTGVRAAIAVACWVIAIADLVIFAVKIR